MNSKQTDSNQDLQKNLDDFLPVSAKRKAKPVNAASDKFEADFQQTDDNELSGASINNGVTIQQDEAVDTVDTLNTTDSLQTQATGFMNATLPKRTSGKQRKESLEEYRRTFLAVPRLEDRKPVFISREVRDRIDEIVHRLGGRGRSVSGFIENLARHHLEIYREDVEGWKRL